MFRIAMALFVSILAREHEPSLSRTRTRGIESAIYLIWGVDGRFTTDGYRDRPGQGYLGIVLHNTPLPRVIHQGWSRRKLYKSARRGSPAAPKIGREPVWEQAW